jgi:hypothetical protein
MKKMERRLIKLAGKPQSEISIGQLLNYTLQYLKESNKEIEGLKSSVSMMDKKISSNTNTINSNANNIGMNLRGIDSNKDIISSQGESITSNTEAISNLDLIRCETGIFSCTGDDWAGVFDTAVETVTYQSTFTSMPKLMVALQREDVTGTATHTGNNIPGGFADTAGVYATNIAITGFVANCHSTNGGRKMIVDGAWMACGSV